jgi:hypothetical protein
MRSRGQTQYEAAQTIDLEVLSRFACRWLYQSRDEARNGPCGVIVARTALPSAELPLQLSPRAIP